MPLSCHLLSWQGYSLSFMVFFVLRSTTKGCSVVFCYYIYYIVIEFDADYHVATYSRSSSKLFIIIGGVTPVPVEGGLF